MKGIQQIKRRELGLTGCDLLLFCMQIVKGIVLKREVIKDDLEIKAKVADLEFAYVLALPSPPLLALVVRFRSRWETPLQEVVWLHTHWYLVGL